MDDIDIAAIIQTFRTLSTTEQKRMMDGVSRQKKKVEALELAIICEYSFPEYSQPDTRR